MNIIATNAAEIVEFIEAEQVIAGTELMFTSNDKATGRQVQVPAAYLIARIEEADKLGLSVREIESAAGVHMVQIHQGGSVYGTYRF